MPLKNLALGWAGVTVPCGRPLDYPKEWIDKRLRGMAVRQDLTDEWKECAVTRGQ